MAFLLLAVAGVIASLSNIALLLEHAKRLERLHQESLPALVAAYEISRQGESITNAASSLMRTSNKWNRGAFVNRISDQFDFIERELMVISKLGYGKGDVKRIRQHKEDLQQSFAKLTHFFKHNDGMALNTVRINQLLLQNTHYADLMSILVANLTKNVSAEIDGLILNTRSDIRQAIWLLSLYSVGAIFFALLVVFYLDNNVSRRVVAIQRAMRAVANGDQSQKIPQGGHDEISDMGASLGIFVEKIEGREERLQELVIEAKDASKDKSVFLAAASHDMRQPLQAMSLFFYTLRNNEVSEENRKIIDRLEHCADSLGYILNKLLDISRLEAGVFEVKLTTVSLQSMLESLMYEFAPVVAKRGLSLDIVPCSQNVHSDPVLLENILRNLIANAIKYTDHGRVLVGCRRHGDDHVEIQICDTGRGIEDKQQSKIFEEFYQIGLKTGTSQKGIGLGLSIVKKLADLMNLELNLSSKLGQGSMFSITVPLADPLIVSQDNQSVENKTATFEHLSIIVIDDEEPVRKSLSLMLTSAGHHVVSAPDVAHQDAVVMRRFPQQCPDIIIADYRLENEITGVQAIARLCDYYKTDIPALLLTGDTATHRLTEISKSGYALLHKPVGGEDLLLRIDEVLQEHPTERV